MQTNVPTPEPSVSAPANIIAEFFFQFLFYFIFAQNRIHRNKFDSSGQKSQASTSAIRDVDESFFDLTEIIPLPKKKQSEMKEETRLCKSSYKHTREK